jgi:hypothetical protein
VDAAHGPDPGLPEVVLLDAVARPVDGEDALEGDGVGLVGVVGAQQGELSVQGDQQGPVGCPARRYGGDVAVDADRPAVDDEGARAAR